jgi:hypothetical protein
MGCWIDVERDVYAEDPSGAMVLIGEADEVLTFASTESTWSGPVGGVGTLAVRRSAREVVVAPKEAHRHRQHFLVVRENQSSISASGTLHDLGLDAIGLFRRLVAALPALLEQLLAENRHPRRSRDAEAYLVAVDPDDRDRNV